jgi:hypothetical protein
MVANARRGGAEGADRNDGGERIYDVSWFSTYGAATSTTVLGAAATFETDDM